MVSLPDALASEFEWDPDVMSEATALRSDVSGLAGLLAALRRLDHRLDAAVAAMQATVPEAAGDPYRGLYISQAEVERLLACPPGESPLAANGSASLALEAERSAASPRLTQLVDELGLGPFDREVVLLALAPELDLRYERLYAYLQDDVTRRRPTVDLALNLLCRTAAERLTRRAAFGPEAPLVRAGWLRLLPDPAQVEPPLLAHYLKLDDRLVSWLLGLVERLESSQDRATPADPPKGQSGPPDEAQVASSPWLGSAALDALAHKLALPYGWPDLVLPPDQLGQLQEICARARHRPLVYDGWGFGRKLAHGRGLQVLFSGPPGTGKTMAAAVIANELGLDLYRIELAQVVSKYIGETEKNLERVFSAAERREVILFFDEADALFGKRSEVKDSHDRYANLEISYLLQRMEAYDGLAILATNLRQHLDEAFLRRLQVSVEFPFPDEAQRRRIWATLFPSEAPLDPAVDFDLLARELKLAGGNLKNIALTAAFYAASDGNAIRLHHLAQAARREYQKLGRAWDDAVFAGPKAE
jgi:hypothetical protein